MSLASSRENSYLIGIEKIRFLYFAISADHASSLPLRHSLTRRSSDQASSLACSSLVAAWVIGVSPNRERGASQIHWGSADRGAHRVVAHGRCGKATLSRCCEQRWLMSLTYLFRFVQLSLHD